MTETSLPVGSAALLAQREWVRRVARALVADVHAAEDLEQDLWVEVLERPPRPRTSLRGWLAAALRHHLLSVKRSDARRARREFAASRREAVEPRQVVEEAEVHRRVVNAVMELAEPYRTAVLLRFFENLPPSAIAARLSVPTETVRTRVRRALDLLRERLDAQTGGDRAAWCAALLPLVRPSPSTSCATAAEGVLMTNKAVAAMAAAAVLAAGGSVAWTASRRAADDVRLRDAVTAARAAQEQAASLAAEVARLREAVGSDADAAPPRRDAAAPPPRSAAARPPSAHSVRIADLERSVAAFSAGTGATDVPRRGKETLEKLLAVKEMEKRRTIRSLIDELVRMGDAVVPDVLAALNSGVEHVFVENHGYGMAAGILTGWGSQRMELYDVLRQIETPAADAAFLDAVGKSHRVTDYQDLLILHGYTNDPAMLRGISALVPDMLRKMIEVGGIKKADQQALRFSQNVAAFITSREVSDAAGLVEDLLTKAPVTIDGLDYECEPFFRALATFAPERAARVALDARQRSPDGRAVTAAANWLRGVPFARQIPYYETLLAQGDLDARARAGLFAAMWTRPSDLIKDLAKRVEDARPFVAFLEGKLAQEPDADVRRQIERALGETRKAIEQTQKQQQ